MRASSLLVFIALDVADEVAAVAVHEPVALVVRCLVVRCLVVERGPRKHWYFLDVGARVERTAIRRDRPDRGGEGPKALTGASGVASVEHRRGSLASSGSG